MTTYAETSAVLRWLFNEPRGEQILETLRASTTDDRIRANASQLGFEIFPTP